VTPDIVPKEKQTVFMRTGLGNVKVTSKKWDKQRIEQVVDKLGEDFGSFAEIRLGGLLTV